MITNRIKYSNGFIKRFKPYDFHSSNKTKRKHHGGWQRALKQTTLYRTPTPVIVSPNRRSLPNKIMHLQSLLSSDTYHSTAIVTLQETWLHELYDDNLVSLNGFILFRQDRLCSRKKRGGGAATFIHSKWSPSNNVCFFSSDFIDCTAVKCSSETYQNLNTPSSRTLILLLAVPPRIYLISPSHASKTLYQLSQEISISAMFLILNH
ncbi:unnamed protein product [Trichobilharzia regenti]|nr:unnamed protein product [Trichobilharzia regenti]